MQVRRKILVIDDDAVTRELLRSVLTKADYEVVLAEDGLSGVETARCEAPDLVITDALLPKMHGFLVCKAIKAFFSPPKVIILTGLYTKPTYKWSVKRDYGADDLLMKPITPAALLACVAKHLADLVHLDLPEISPPAISTRKPENNWRLVGRQGNTRPHVESGGVKFSDAEMEDIFKEWSIPCS
jgi:DNA-binding response OmpR family regulator